MTARDRDTPQMAGFDGRTLAVLLACLGVWALGLAMAGLAGFALVAFALVLHSSLTHEILHGIAFRSGRLGTAVGLVQPGIAIPYLRFKRQHLAHHNDAKLTDPYDDPETNYLDPQVWDRLGRMHRTILRLNNTLMGRMLVGPALGQWAFMAADWRAMRAGDRQIAMDWALHLPGVIAVLSLVAWSPMSVWNYLLACYAALAVLKIRTFLEHQAHVHSAARTAIVEDRGILAFLFLNNNLHVIHHMYPSVPWHRLPALYRDQRERFQARNQGYVFASYGAIFRQFLWRSKDPVPHPLWPAPKD